MFTRTVTFCIKNGIFIIFLLFLVPKLDAQKISEKDFFNAQWFTENIDTLFYKSDTVQFILCSNSSPEWGLNEFAESPLKYFGHGEYLSFHFKKNRELEIWETHKNYINSVYVADFKWDFNSKKQILTTIKNEQIYFQFKVINKKQIEIESKYSKNEALLKTSQLTLVKLW